MPVLQIRSMTRFLLATLLFCCATAAFSEAAFVRVSQVGYEEGHTARAYLMSTGAAPGARFSVLDKHGAKIFTGAAGSLIGTWGHSSTVTYQIYPLDFQVPRGETYTIRVSGPVSANSPKFAVEPPDSLYAGLLLNTRFFYDTERDGPAR
jgi:hypothetical protein